MATTPVHVITLLTEGGQAQAEVVVNEALRVIDASLQVNVTARQATPPGSPSEGDTYIVGASPTGDWSSFTTEDLAFYVNGAWVNKTPVEGWRVYLTTTNIDIKFDGTSWVGADEFQVSASVHSGDSQSEATLLYSSPGIEILELNYVYQGTLSGTNPTYTVRYASDRSAAGTEVVTSGTSISNAAAGIHVTSLNNADVPDNNWLWFEVDTTGFTGTPVEHHASVRYRKAPGSGF